MLQADSHVTPGAVATSKPVATAAASQRLRLAHLARDATLRVPGVVALTPDGGYRTVGGGMRVDGIRCVAADRGTFEVAVSLRCELVPLMALAARVQSGIKRAAMRAELPLAAVHVLIADIAERPIAP